MIPRTRIRFCPDVEALEARIVPQATRTWVSGVGDDVNPCSRTAPCKTFAGAISKTAAGGEISVLDPGGYGNVTITKSITIDGTGTEASIVVPATSTGVLINATTPGIVVVLRGLNINGATTGAQGIRVIGAPAAVFVEDCNIQGFTSNGIEFNPSADSELFVTNTTVQSANLTTPAGTAGAGIYIHPSGGLTKAIITGSQLYNNKNGLFADGNAQVTVSSDTEAFGNSQEDFPPGANGATVSRTGRSTTPVARLTTARTLRVVKTRKKRSVLVSFTGARGTVTGQVLFLAGKQIIGKGTLINGSASLRLKSNQKGRLDVLYLGDSNYVSSGA